MATRSCRAVQSPAGFTTEPNFELTNEQWKLIIELFSESPPGPLGGRPPVPARPCFEGILWMLCSGARWKVDRSISGLQNFRHLVTRYEHHAALFYGFVQLACLVIVLGRF